MSERVCATCISLSMEAPTTHVAPEGVTVLALRESSDDTTTSSALSSPSSVASDDDGLDTSPTFDGTVDPVAPMRQLAEIAPTHATLVAASRAAAVRRGLVDPRRFDEPRELLRRVRHALRVGETLVTLDYPVGEVPSREVLDYFYTIGVSTTRQTVRANACACAASVRCTCAAQAIRLVVDWTLRPYPLTPTSTKGRTIV
jgi:hypothetical protein